jgi:hypothetical protein
LRFNILQTCEPKKPAADSVKVPVGQRESLEANTADQPNLAVIVSLTSALLDRLKKTRQPARLH